MWCCPYLDTADAMSSHPYPARQSREVVAVSGWVHIEAGGHDVVLPLPYGHHPAAATKGRAYFFCNSPSVQASVRPLVSARIFFTRSSGTGEAS